MQRSGVVSCQYGILNVSKMKSIIQLLIICTFLCSCTKTRFENVPDCIENKIALFKRQAKGNPPRSVTQYTYQGEKVFYIPPQCCDKYSDLLDENCNLIGHPDGGFTGRGDGKLRNFFTDAKDEILIWKDDR